MSRSKNLNSSPASKSRVIQVREFAETIAYEVQQAIAAEHRRSAVV
jgi:hypothetical protein